MNKLDEIINEIANETLPEEHVEQAATRVRRKLFGETRVTTERIRGCSDYQSLIPLYLNNALSAGRSLLLQDHTRECPSCRQALSDARAGKVRTLLRPVTPPAHSIPKWWAIAAMAVLTVGIGAFIASQTLFLGDAQMTVQNVSGVLYAVSDNAVTPIFAGRQIPAGQKIRTSRDSTAMVRLADGSRVELNQRAQISVARAVRGMAIHLDRGDIIVQAAKQHSGTLDVVTADCIVSVKGTIFAVDRGTKGSRVSVVEGAVQVAQGAQTQMLKPGQQVSTNPVLAATSVQDAVAWSRNAAQYLALLGEFSEIKKGLDSMPSPALRHDSKLLAYVPDDAVLYAAIPNLGSSIAEADRLFQARLQESAVLKEWWDQQKNGPQLREMLDKLRTFSDFLGDEIAFTVSGDGEGHYSRPMLLAEVKKPGLDAFLNNEFRTLSLHGSTRLPQVVPIRKPSANANTEELKDAATSKSESSPMLVGIQNNLLAIAWNQAQLDLVAQRMAEPGTTSHSALISSVQDSYKTGAGWLLSVNMEQIARNIVDRHSGTDGPKLPTGLDGMRYLVVERKDIAGKTQNQATLTFGGRRSGMAAWLAEPAPMGSLDFVSPNASFAVSLVLRSPQWMLSDIFAALANNDPKFQANLDRLRQETGLQISPSLGEPLGGEMTFAIDGPLLPLPSWKLALEVYSPDRLEWTIEQFVAAFNKNTQCADCTLALTHEQANGRTYYTLASPKFSYEIDYTFVDGYLVAAPSRTLLNTAIQNRASGYVLARSEAFRSQLPTGGNLNFSGLVYHNVGGALKPFADQIGNLGGATAAQQKSIAALAANSTPGLIYLTGQSDRITVASNGGFFGLDLNTFALPALMERAMHLKGNTQQ